MAKRKAKPKPKAKAAKPAVAPEPVVKPPVYTESSLEERVTTLEARFERLKICMTKKYPIEPV